MKRSMLTGIAFAALTVGPVLAADLRPAPRPVYTKAPVMAPVYSWTGLYVGLNGGYSWGRASTDFTITGVPVGSSSSNMDGWLGGGQIGYNWQTGQYVLGLEADIQATGQKGTFAFATPTVCPPPGVLVLPCATGNGSVEQKLPWFGTLRGRLGFTPTPTWLLYVTGGLAYGEVDTNVSFTNTVAFLGGPVVGATATSGSSSATKVGWVIGAGAEWAISGPWSAKLEYLYMDLGTVNTSFAVPAPFALVNTSSRITDNIVRVGINYRFGGGPVMAGY
jgi:outer membrane immunogenic protein